MCISDGPEHRCHSQLSRTTWNVRCKYNSGSWKGFSAGEIKGFFPNLFQPLEQQWVGWGLGGGLTDRWESGLGAVVSGEQGRDYFLTMLIAGSLATWWLLGTSGSRLGSKSFSLGHPRSPLWNTGRISVLPGHFLWWHGRGPSKRPPFPGLRLGRGRKGPAFKVNTHPHQQGRRHQMWQTVLEGVGKEEGWHEVWVRSEFPEPLQRAVLLSLKQG